MEARARRQSCRERERCRTGLSARYRTIVTKELLRSIAAMACFLSTSVLLLSGCGGSGNSSAILIMTATETPTASPSASSTPTPSGTPTPSPTATTTPAITSAIFVTSSACNWVTAYPLGASGNISPIVSSTNLCQPSGIALDSTGDVYVASQAQSAVIVYPAGSNGNVAPSAAIVGSSTGLDGPSAIAVGADGRIYVANSNNNRVTVIQAAAMATSHQVPESPALLPVFNSPRGLR